MYIYVYISFRLSPRLRRRGQACIYVYIYLSFCIDIYLSIYLSMWG